MKRELCVCLDVCVCVCTMRQKMSRQLKKRVPARTRTRRACFVEQKYSGSLFGHAWLYWPLRLTETGNGEVTSAPEGRGGVTQDREDVLM